MDMYQKRKIRKENKNEDKELHSVPINCEKPIYINFFKNIDNTGFLMLRFLHF